MISAQWHKVLNDLWGNKTRTLLIVLSIGVGLFATGAIISTRTVLASQMAQGYAATHPSSGTIRTLEPFNEEFVRSVRAMKGVQDADGRRNMTFRIQAQSGKWLTLRLFAISDYSDMHLNRVQPQSGAWPPPEHELLLERTALALLGARVGDTVRVETPDKKQRELRIAGLTHDLSQFPARFTNTAYGYIAFNTLEWLGEPYGFNTLHIVAENPSDKAYARSILDAVETKTKKSGLTVLSTSVDKFPLDEMVETVMLLLSILGLLSLCLSAFLIVNTISALLAQQVRQIGVMKAIGARTDQIMSMYLAMVVMYGLMGLVIAVPPGILGSYVLCRLTTDLLNFDLSFGVPPQTILIQVAIGLIVPVLASLYPFLSGLRVTAAEAMSTCGVSQRQSWTGPISRLFSGPNIWFARRVLVRPWLLSVRNTFRSRTRLSLTLTTLTLAGAIFISVFSVRASLFHTIGDLLQWRAFDSMLTFTRPYRTEKIEQEALRVPGVVETDVWIEIPMIRVRADKSDSDTVFLFAPRSGSDLVSPPVMIQGRWLEPSDQDAVVVNAYLLKKETDIKLGDEIVLKIDGRERSWRVVGVCLGQAPPTAYANYAPVARMTGNVGRASTVVVTIQQRDEASAVQVAGALESHFKDMGLHTDSAETTAEERNKDEASYGILIAGLLAMAVLFAIVGGLGLMGTMSINVIERTREIGVMRAIGAPTRSVAQVFVVESVAIGVLSWLFATLLALPLSKVMSDAVGIPLMGTPITFNFSMAGVGLWLLVVVLLSVLASFIPARNASRLTVREVLAYE